ncbi:hypothetical protein M0802_010016 [Mischocyttarus mexicanus]|nr:hypothetical protein M0802_010016 [Mischocyttarus mexicanus]
MSNADDGQNGSTVLPSSTTLATCHKDYPSGCTILECRLDAYNRPVAQILQVPGLDSDVNSQKMGLYVEAKHTPSGTYSRVTSCPVEDTCEQQSKENVPLLRTYALESGQISNNDVHPVSKIIYGPMLEKVQVSDNQERCPESSEIEVECLPMREEIEHCNRPNATSRQTEILENIVNPKEYIYRSPPNCEASCTGAAERKFLPQFCERRNGLDQTASQSMLRPIFVDRSIKKTNRICPARCCKPLEKSLLDRTRQLSLKNQEECRKDIRIIPTVVEFLECPRILRKCCKDAFSLSASQDSLERYKDYVSTSQLDRYRACRSKRNGLQDECFLPNRIVEEVSSSQKKSPRSQQYEDKSSQKSCSTKGTTKRRLRRVKSRELYAGQVFVDCDCYHRNGLQHDCPRTLCGGEPCVKLPLPKCDLGNYFLDKWNCYYDKLDRLMPTAFCGSQQQWLEEILKRETTNSQKVYDCDRIEN